MDCEIIKVKNEIVISINGRLDASNSNDIGSQIVELIDNGNLNFVANLEKLEYISSAGLRVFLFIGEKLGDKGHIHLCCLQDQIKEVFIISGFSSIFKLFDDLDSAVSYENDDS
ncbi:MAG: STAS domain-containing protein [Bacteroidetes bacterium]|nr:STAS domain-containing protein [Bacteroidota bacterium]